MLGLIMDIGKLGFKLYIVCMCMFFFWVYLIYLY